MHDVVTDELPHNKFDFVCGFYLFHFIAIQRWPAALNHIVPSMTSDGLLLLTTEMSSNCAPINAQLIPGRSILKDKKTEYGIYDFIHSELYPLRLDVEVLTGHIYSCDEMNIDLLRQSISEDLFDKIINNDAFLVMQNYAFNKDQLGLKIVEEAPQLELVPYQPYDLRSVALAFGKKLI